MLLLARGKRRRKSQKIRTYFVHPTNQWPPAMTTAIFCEKYFREGGGERGKRQVANLLFCDEEELPIGIVRPHKERGMTGKGRRFLSSGPAGMRRRRIIME